MGKLSEKSEEKIAKAVKKMIEQARSEWPPLCLGLLYQPKRPQKVKNSATPESEQ